ncbi:T9SS type A sorting domain-containing protein [Flavobacterium sp.]|uniref:T9SS type A sorting domain-containing protein n=1 Tax=Flavobacterium sp. TaxID=239 RepID=UPI00286CDC94|nr:T9SS type A sorting domain-containing protein [Flavobacterium sp.]
MKKITFLFLFIWNFGFGQNTLSGNATYKLEINGYIGDGTEDNCCCGGLRFLYLFQSNNVNGVIVKAENGHIENTSFSYNTEHNEYNLLTNYRIGANFNSGTIFCGSTSSSLTSGNILFSRLQDSPIINLPVPHSLRLKNYPIVNLINSDISNNLVGNDDYVNIYGMYGILDQYYNWQYSTNPDYNSSSWTNLPPQFQGKSFLSAKPSEFLPDNLIGSQFFLRVKTNNFGTNNQGSILPLVYLKSAPHIEGAPTTTPVRCYSDTNDGSATFTFNRLLIGCNGCKQQNNLIPDETLNYTLLNRVTSTPVRSGNVIMNADKTFTISNLPSGDYTIKFTGDYDGFNTYTSGINHTRNFTIEKPQLPVAFTATKTNVLCYNGNDGKIILNASGGTTQGSNTYQYSLDLGTTWVSFTNGNTHTITDLNPRNYIIKVKDSKACVARVQRLVGTVIELGIDIELPITIQPIATPVVVNYTEVEQPKFYGGTNGKIVATVIGGTPFANNRYDFEWKNSLGVVQTNTNTYFSGGIFYITLNNVGADTYKLTVKDKNYATATQQGGCSVLDSEQILPQPQPIVVTFTAIPPKCNANNQFGNETDLNPADGKRDETQNGQLLATVTGGVPYTGFDNYSKPYKYFWKKQLPDGTWQSIDNQNTTLPYVSDGNYALNVEDSNLIKLGIYTNNILTQEVDKTILVQQPAQLELTLTKQDVTCGNANTGSATANVSGGVSGYTYQWNDANGSTTPTISGLGAGDYFVRVTDANRCVVQGSVNLPQPSNIVISDSVQKPSCFQGSDGAIDLIIRGGNAPFTYLWNTRASSKDLANIPAGNYSVTITDRLGCTFQHNVVLINPDPIVVNLGSDRTLCNNQSHALDISITDPNPQYFWTSTNGFTSRSATVNLTKAGTYYAKVISSLGCISQDDIIIQTNQVNIESEFFVTSQAYLDEEVMLVNTSNPFGENTQWVIPNGVSILDQQQKFVVLKFNTIGTHTISLKQTQGDCYALFSKNIKVEDRSTIPNANNNNSPFIKDFIVTPNPSNGQFTTVVNLQEISPVKLRLFSYSGQTAIIQKSEAGKKNYVVDFNVALPSGTYVLVLETAQQTLIRKIIIL